VVSASVGVAVAAHHTSTEDLLSEADKAMYLAKQRGRGRLVVGHRAGPNEHGSRHSLERELHLALDDEQLLVYYQPIVTTDSAHTVVAVEALLRWDHPYRGLLDAEAFIGLAERSGVLGAMGRWVIEKACAQLADWRLEFRDRAPNQVFVNLSPREIADATLDAVLTNAMSTHGVQPSSLGLEIIEDDFADSLLLPRLTEHHQRGHPLAIDDFGTGYSSLARLVNFPVQYAKIDRAFVSALSEDPMRRSLIETIVVIAHHLGITVIAEGVETEQQVIDLTTAGCDLIQGYHISRPQPAEALADQWRARDSLPRLGDRV
jgi:EAL domain-containing protein (putative c-di-GMP-specific phosphodiesterase class I)